MRIDGTSLIAAQSFQTQRTQQAAATPTQTPGKPLFEPLNFPKVEEQPGPSKAALPAAQAAPRRLGSQLDITV